MQPVASEWLGKPMEEAKDVHQCTGIARNRSSSLDSG